MDVLSLVQVQNHSSQCADGTAGRDPLQSVTRARCELWAACRPVPLSLGALFLHRGDRHSTGTKLRAWDTGFVQNGARSFHPTLRSLRSSGKWWWWGRCDRGCPASGPPQPAKPDCGCPHPSLSHSSSCHPHGPSQGPQLRSLPRKPGLWLQARGNSPAGPCPEGLSEDSELLTDMLTTFDVVAKNFST